MLITTICHVPPIYDHMGFIIQLTWVRADLNGKNGASRADLEFSLEKKGTDTREILMLAIVFG